MPLPSLEDATPALDRICADVLGDTIQYAADGVTFMPIKTFGDYRDAVRAFEASQVVTQDILVSILKVDVPAKPSGSVRIRLPKIPGVTFRPVNVRGTEIGTEWEMDLQAANG